MKKNRERKRSPDQTNKGVQKDREANKIAELVENQIEDLISSLIKAFI